MRIVANLEKIITLTDSQYQTLLDNGTVGGYTGINPNYLYMVPEETIALSDIDGTTDLQAIENLTGTSGFLKKTGANTWSLDTNTYLTSVAASGSGGITISGSPITTSGTIAIGLNLSTAINGLGEGTSPAQLNDYLVAQYAGGGTTTTTYHRRKVSNVVNATVVKAALSTDATHNNQFLRKDGTWQTPPYPVTSVAGNTGVITADTLRTSLGLSNAMHFLGVTTTNISTGTANTTATVAISGSNVTAAAGDVVLYGSQEYVWGNSKWNLLGDESSYKVKQTAKSDPTALTTTSTTFIDTISQDENGVITATKKTLPAYPESFTITASATDGLWNLTGTSGTNQVTYAVGAYSSKQSTAAFYTAATDPTLTTRLNYDGYLYATKLYSSGNEVLTTHQTIKQDGITGATITRFGTCSIAAGTAAKTVSISSGTFTLESGAKVTVNFTYANTADNPTLNVNSKGAKNIFHRGARITTGVNKALLAGVCDFVYDGTQWHLIGNYYDTTYSSESAASGGTTLSLVTTGEKYTWNNKANTATTLSGYGITDAKIANGVITLGSNTITPLTAASDLNATKLTGTIPASCYTDTNTTYSLSGTLSSHKFTSTLTAGGSGTGTSTSEFTLAAGTGISLEDNTSTKTITINNTVSNTDVSVTNTAVTAATTYYLTGSTSSSTTTGGLSKHASVKAYVSADNTTGGLARLDLGNATATSSTGGKKGVIRLYGTTTYYVGLEAGDPTTNQTITFPNKTGTVALTTDIPDVSGKIDTAGTGLSKSGTTLNHSNSVTAQTTQAIYPIKIDAQGHISSYGSAVTPLTASSTLDATKLSGTVPSGCYTNSRDAGYGKITPANNTSTTSALTGNTTAVVASNYSENLKLTAANKWVVLAGTNSDTAGSDELKIAHLVPSSITNNGPTSNQTGSRGSTFNIPKITLDEAGHVTGISSITVSLPSSDNTDEKVKQNSSTTSAAYKLLMTTTASPTSGNTYETNYATTLSYNPSTKVLTNGTITLTTASSTSANGNAYDVLSLGNSANVTSTTAHSEGKINIYSAATKSHIIVGKSTTTDYTHTLPNQSGLLVTLNSDAPSADVGSTTKPVYVSSAGVVTEASTYAGGTKVTLNGTSAGGSTASFYAPTGAGSSGQYLKSNGSGAPSWTNFPTIPSITLNGSSTTSPSFYAPTGAGTSGQYLKSNGSGAPTWANMPAAVTATSSGSGNVVTGMSVTNNAITYTLGTVSTVSAQIVRW